MRPGELLDSIREHYLARLLASATEAGSSPDLIMEPAHLTRDGQAAVEGNLALPYRSDFVLTADGRAVRSVLVDTDSMLSFEPVAFAWDDRLAVSINPFQWNRCECNLTEGPSRPDWEPFRLWFLKCFEERATQEDGLHGCVHFMSDPEAVPGGFCLEVDFGSGPVESFEELLDVVAEAGFGRCRIGGGA